jgi:hypothetical protein
VPGDAEITVRFSADVDAAVIIKGLVFGGKKGEPNRQGESIAVLPCKNDATCVHIRPTGTSHHIHQTGGEGG